MSPAPRPPGEPALEDPIVLLMRLGNECSVDAVEAAMSWIHRAWKILHAQAPPVAPAVPHDEAIERAIDDYTGLVMTDCQGGIPAGIDPDPVKEARARIVALLSPPAAATVSAERDVRTDRTEFEEALDDFEKALDTPHSGPKSARAVVVALFSQSSAREAELRRLYAGATDCLMTYRGERDAAREEAKRLREALDELSVGVAAAIDLLDADAPCPVVVRDGKALPCSCYPCRATRCLRDGRGSSDDALAAAPSPARTEVATDGESD